MKKVLFIHHGGFAGGAPLSMLYTMKGMRAKGYQPIAALRNPSKELHALYNKEGFETFETKWIPMFITCSGNEGKRYNPIMWNSIFNIWKNWEIAQKKLLAFIEEQNIDIVHLNSVSLSNPASILIEKKIPFIWHVRETGPKHKGKRYQFIKDKLLAATNVIYLSKAEQKSWTGDNKHGAVVGNFIDFDQFDSNIDITSTLQKLEIESDEKILLYVGGTKNFKGIIPLLKAMKIVKEKWGSNFVCLMPDVHIEDQSKATRFQKQVLSEMDKSGLKDNCKMMPFDPNIVPLFSICDMLVFPATQPHFARPIIEASGMKKPVIASDLECINELVIQNETGYLVRSGDSEKLAEKIIHLFDHPEVCTLLGNNGYQFVKENFEFNKQVDKILKVYQQAESTKQPQYITSN